MSQQPLIRKLPPPVEMGFDEQLWPVNVALLVFGGFVAGLIVVNSDFGVANPLLNGYIRLATLAITLGALLIGISVGGKQARRMQLGVMISLIVHSGALMTVQVAPKLLGHGTGQSEAPVNPPVVLHDLTVLVPTAPRDTAAAKDGSAAAVSEIERPLEVQSKMADSMPEQPLLKIESRADPSVRKPDVATPRLALDEVIAPDRVKRDDAPHAAPKRADSPSTLSKSLAKVDIKPAEKISNLPEKGLDTPSAELPRLDQPAVATAVQRQVTANVLPKESPLPSVSPLAKVPAANLKRDVNDSKPPEIAAAAASALAKASTRPLDAPKLDAVAVASLPKLDGSAAAAVGQAAVGASKQIGAPAVGIGNSGALLNPSLNRQPTLAKPKPAIEVPQIATARPAAPAKAAVEVSGIAAETREPNKIPGIASGSIAAEQPVAGPAIGSLAKDVVHGTPLPSITRAISATPALGIPGSGTPSRTGPLSASTRGERTTIGAGLPGAKNDLALPRAATSGNVAASPIAIDSPGIALPGAVPTPAGTGPASVEFGKAGGAKGAGRGPGGVGAGLASGTGSGTGGLGGSLGNAAGAAASKINRPTAGGVAASGPSGVAKLPSMTARAPGGGKLPSAYAPADEVVMSDRIGPAMSTAGSGAGGGNGPSSDIGVAKPSAASTPGGIAGIGSGKLGGSGGPGGGGSPTAPELAPLGATPGHGGGGGPSSAIGAGGGLARSAGSGISVAGINSNIPAAVPQAPLSGGSGGDAAAAPSSTATVSSRAGGGGLGAATIGQVVGPLGGTFGGAGNGGGSFGAADGIAGGQGGGGNIAGALFGRAAPGEGLPGGVVGGGGVGIARAGSQIVVGESVADAPQQMVTGDGAGSPTGTLGATGGSLEIRGDGPVRQHGGLSGLQAATGQPDGTVIGGGGDNTLGGAISGAGGLPTGMRGGVGGGGDGPTVGGTGDGGPQRRVSDVSGLGGGTADVVAVGQALISGQGSGGSAGGAGGPGVGGAGDGDGEVGPQPVAVGRTAGGPAVGAIIAGTGGSLGTGVGGAGGLNVDVAALPGAGGVSADLGESVGLTARQARRDSDVIRGADGRFLQRAAGGPVTIEGQVRDAAASFGGRGKRLADGGAGGAGRPAAGTDRAIELGLEFLSNHQSKDGRWSIGHFPGATTADAGSFDSDAAGTGLALLAFLGAGYDHFDDKYQDNVRAGLQFLISHQQANGNLFIPLDNATTKSDLDTNQFAQLYSHGIAALALSEAYGMTGDKNLKEPAQKAIDFIVKSQDPKLGGWRYRPGIDSDTSVSGWQVMALKSGELARLNVPPQTYERVREWLYRAQANEGDASQYVYHPGRGSTEQTRPTRSMNAAGLLMRMYLGWTPDEPAMIRGAQFLQTNLPSQDSIQTRDTYYWYYATQVMFHMKGDHWKAWNEKLYPMLVEGQIKTGPLHGSWDPNSPVPDHWGSAGGRIYVTSLNLLSLEVLYRHLPLYDSEKFAPPPDAVKP